MIRVICGDDNIRSQVVGIVNLNARRSLSKANYYSYLDIAEEFGIPLHFCDNVNDEETVRWIADRNPDLLIHRLVPEVPGTAAEAAEIRLYR